MEKLNSQDREKPFTDELNKHWIKLFAKTCQGDLCPIQAIIGGIAAQEAMKVEVYSIETFVSRFLPVGCNRKIHADYTVSIF